MASPALPPLTAELEAVLQHFGIAKEYIEFSGNHKQIELAARLHMLQCMGESLRTEADVSALSQRIAQHNALLPPMLSRSAAAGAVPIQVPHSQLSDTMISDTIKWQLSLEDGSLVSGSAPVASMPRWEANTSPRAQMQTLGLVLPTLICGYHQLVVELAGQRAESLLVISPPQAWQPFGYADGKHWWGLACQLYTVRSDDNWGMGDFADLLHLVELAAKQGAGFVLLNPLHYLDLRYPDNASPYSPSDRRFLNPLYIALEWCPEFLAGAVQAWVNQVEFQHNLKQLRAAAWVDYHGVAAVKLPLLGMMFQHFQQQEKTNNSERAQQFSAYCKAAGAGLQGFADYQASLQIRDEAVFKNAEFHCYLQWLAQTQLEACQQLAQHTGMGIGLIRDLAVGSSSDGAEVVDNPELFCLEARVGAPPDNMNPHGQNWGLPPLLPNALLQTRCAHFIALLRSNMQSCGALRIDHVMALLRLWWCPNDGSNANGAYVHYPVELLFAILRLESCRARCVVIGEDLGVVPPEIRQYLDGGGIYSNCVFYFEKYDGWHFRKPEHYKEQALMMLANHDVAPLRAWWELHDLPLRRQLGLLVDDAQLQHEQQQRQHEKAMLLTWLAEQQLLPASWHKRNVEQPLDALLLNALFTAAARTKSRFLSVQLEDLAGVSSPVNVPGTSNEYPNWRRKLPLDLTKLFSASQVQGWLQTLRTERNA